MKLSSEERVTRLDPVFGAMGIEAGRRLWSAPDFTMREKAILLISADIAVPELGLPFELHVNMALTQAGMSMEEVRELLRHVALYAGFNITAMAFERLLEVASSIGHETCSTGERLDHRASPYSPESLDELYSLDDVFAAEFDELTSEVWARPGMSLRERTLSALAIDVVGGTLGPPFAAHVAIAARNGVLREQLRAMIRLLEEYSLPRAWCALRALQAVPACQGLRD